MTNMAAASAAAKPRRKRGSDGGPRPGQLPPQRPARRTINAAKKQLSQMRAIKAQQRGAPARVPRSLQARLNAGRRAAPRIDTLEKFLHSCIKSPAVGAKFVSVQNLKGNMESLLATWRPLTHIPYRRLLLCKFMEYRLSEIEASLEAGNNVQFKPIRGKLLEELQGQAMVEAPDAPQPAGSGRETRSWLSAYYSRHLPHLQTPPEAFARAIQEVAKSFGPALSTLVDPVATQKPSDVSADALVAKFASLAVGAPEPGAAGAAGARAPREPYAPWVHVFVAECLEYLEDYCEPDEQCAPALSQYVRIKTDPLTRVFCTPLVLTVYRNRPDLLPVLAEHFLSDECEILRPPVQGQRSACWKFSLALVRRASPPA